MGSFEHCCCLSPVLRNSGLIGLESAWAFSSCSEDLNGQWMIEWMVGKVACVFLSQNHTREKTRQILKGKEDKWKRSQTLGPS